ncbi:hypothetical protein QAD02_004934 [Eretmocerus hayati]|uniref:Uncharacterized protein n=1 Tax=Eretmocerus hayati TaxID=131215 RepID=A0ACC2NRD1_9HYME|nr:hypothetical protein QAD02_004934 [Eretmocerus hayati]
MGRYTKKQWLTLIAVCTAEFGSAMCISLQAPFYPSEAEKKGVPASEYGLVFGIFELVVFFMSPVYGKHINKIGAKKLLNIGTFTTGTCAILFGLLDRIENHYPFIILSFVIRIIEALGSSAYFTASSATMANEFPDRISITFATLKIFFGLGLIVGPTIGGLLYEVGGYPMPFVVLGLILYIACLMTIFVLPAHQSADKSIKSEGKLKKILRVKGVMMSAASITVTSISIGFLQATLEPHLRPFGLNAIGVGFMFIISGGTYAVTAPMWGWICDKRKNSKITAVIGSLLIMTAFTLIGPAPFVPTPTLFWMVIVGLVIHGLGVAAKLVSGFTNALKSAVASGFSNDMDTYGIVSGLWTSSFALGAFIGPSVAGLLYDAVGMRKACLFVILLTFIMAFSTLTFIIFFDQVDTHYDELGIDNAICAVSSMNKSLGGTNAAAMAAQGIPIEQPMDLAGSFVASSSNYTGAWLKPSTSGFATKPVPNYGTLESKPSLEDNLEDSI